MTNKQSPSRHLNTDRFNSRPSQVRHREADLRHTLKKLLLAPLVALYMLFHRNKPTPKLVSHRLGKQRNQPCPCGKHKTVIKPVVRPTFGYLKSEVTMGPVSVPVKYKKCCWNSDYEVAV
ncbi:hypothetical protein LCGC14_0415810 [marine sediment metagenome]|uniref:Uncharacterized protein n=1 Tax=marine sediment metagenome TaxID=412755 RepID=A0A0F9SSG4_9ZZZZ